MPASPRQPERRACAQPVPEKPLQGDVSAPRPLRQLATAAPGETLTASGHCPARRIPSAVTGRAACGRGCCGPQG